MYRLMYTMLTTVFVSIWAVISWPVPEQTTTPVPAFSHIFIIVLENKELNRVIGNSNAPYFNQLAQTYGLATQSYGQRHPSLPNYIAVTSGSTQGITSDCVDCFINASNIIDQFEESGRSWKAYMDGMPGPCFVGDYGTVYRQKHNPFIYYDSIRTNSSRCNKIVPFTEFSADARANAFADYVWITPNMCNDQHNCSIKTGDKWLKKYVPQILASPAWQENGLLIITYDEGTTDARCCTGAVGGRIPSLVISPLGKPAYRSAIAYDQYSVLRTVEESWGLPLLGSAASARSPSFSDFFAQSVGTPSSTSPISPTPAGSSAPQPTVTPSNNHHSTRIQLPSVLK